MSGDVELAGPAVAPAAVDLAKENLIPLTRLRELRQGRA